MDGNKMEIGDIILAKGLSKKSKRIMSGQSVFSIFCPRLKNLEFYSHTAMYVGYGLILESRNDTVKGTHISTLYEFFSRYKEWVVYRNSEFDDKNKVKLHLRAKNFLMGGYDILFVEKKFFQEVNTYFCSELIVNVIRQAGIPIFGHIDSKEIPPFFFTLLYNKYDTWSDVTEKYHSIDIDVKALLVRDKMYTLLLTEYTELYVDVRKEYINFDGYSQNQKNAVLKEIESFLNDNKSGQSQPYKVIHQKVYTELYRQLTDRTYLSGVKQIFLGCIQPILNVFTTMVVWSKTLGRVCKNDI